MNQQIQGSYKPGSYIHQQNAFYPGIQNKPLMSQTPVSMSSNSTGGFQNKFFKDQEQNEKNENVQNIYVIEQRINTFKYDEWKKLIRGCSVDMVDHLKLAASLRAGIEQDLRPRLGKSFYQDLLNQEIDKKCESIINKDVERTLQDSSFMKTEEAQKMLFNILKAYSIHEKSVGYCQGISFIVATIMIELKFENYKDLKHSFGQTVDTMDKLQYNIFLILVFISEEKN